jgi:ABC-type nitrate/sulfonate/bicarbonate transport system substrate-binding protein
MKLKSKSITLFTLTALLSLLFLATAGGESHAAGTEKPVVCRLAYASKVHYAPQILASRKGWFAANGVVVQNLKLGMSAGIAGAEALVSGSADVAVMGDVPAIMALASRRDCVLVAAYGGGEKMHSIVVAAGSGITGPADLVGKRLGVQFGSSTHGAVQLYLKRHGIAPARVRLVNIPQKDLVEALISGAIDALAASDPTPAQAGSRVGGARELACLSGLGNDYPLVIVATRDFAAAHPEAVRAIIAGTRKGVDWINRDPAGAGRELALVTGASPEQETATLRKLKWRVTLDERVIRSLSMTAEFLRETGKLKRVPDVLRHARPNFL